MPVHGRRTSVLINQYDLSTYFKTAELNGEAGLLDSTTFQASAKTFVPDFADANVSLNGLWDAKVAPGETVNQIDDVLQPILGVDSDQLFVIANEGAATHGNNVHMGVVKETKYSVTAPHNQLVSVSAELKVCNGLLQQGALMHQLTARTATGNGSVHDNGALSTFGAKAQIHLTAMSGSASPSLAVIIEDSADGVSGWATIGTFTTLTAVGSERISIAGTVRRYIRVSFTITGTTPSFTFAVALARNNS